MAIRNANDGISLAQVAEGSLSEVGNNLQRIRELAVQASNATNSSSDRKALQAEVTQLVSEIDRVAKQSDFNGTKLLDGSFTSQLFQVGANAGQAIAINSVVDAKAESLGSTTFADVYKGEGLTNDKAATDSVFSQLQITVTPPNGGTAKSIDIGDITVKAGESITAATAAAINGKLGETGVMAKIESGKIQLVSVKDGQTFALGNAGAPSKSTTPVPTPVTDFTEIGRIKPQVAPEAPSAPAQSPASSRTSTSPPLKAPSRPCRSSTSRWNQSTASAPTSARSRTASPRWSPTCRPPRKTCRHPAAVSAIPTSPRKRRNSPGPRSCSRPAPQCWPRPTRSLRTCSACCSADIRRS